MKINIMGAAGRLGRKVVKGLLDQGASTGDLVLSARSPAKLNDLAAHSIEVRRADYDDPESMNKAFGGCDVVLLIPSFAPVEARVQQHGAAVDAAVNAGVSRLLFAGFAAATPTSRFLVSPFMLYAEARVRLSGLGWTLLRNGMYLDPIADWIPELKTMGRLPYPVTSGRVAYISRADLGRAAAAACLDEKHTEKLYELTGPQALSMPELAEILTRISGVKIRFDSITDNQFADVCRQGNEMVTEGMIKLLTSLYHAVENGELAAVTDHMEQLTGAPAEPAEQALSRWMS